MVALFIAEPVILYFAKLSDPLNAMFLTLPLAIYLLMTKVLNTKSSTHSSVFYHNVSLYVYVIHPVVILGNRLIIGKVLDGAYEYLELCVDTTNITGRFLWLSVCKGSI